jgi:glutamyl-Q tRNA(Asp) synthetase
VIVSRFAPSPTGRLHLGHAYCALLAHSRADRFLVRIEDLDQGRSRPEFVAAIFEDLRWLGLDWGEPVLIQSERSAAYDTALEKLRSMGLVYPCFCTRSDIAAALEAPHGAQPGYPGTCRLLPDDASRRASEPHSWRLNAGRAIDCAGLPGWSEDGGRLQSVRADFDDVILARKDAPAAYYLACVVDDAASGVTLVTRASDLRSSTPVQRLLQDLLGLSAPAYLHHRMIAHSDGRRLAKRDRAPTLAAMRDAGVDGRDLAKALLAGELPLGFAWLDA